MLSEQIKQARELRGWSQSYLANEIGVAPSTVRRWESGERDPYAYHLLKLQQVLCLSLEPERKRRMDNEQPGTYFVPNSHSQDELYRLHVQAQVMSAKLGGPLPEQPDPTVFQQVLDVGCGTGYWLIELAQVYPTISHLVGVDINPRMIAYAREQAEQEQVSDRVAFQTMDALRTLEFPPDSFDLVNLRFGMSWVRAWDWTRMLTEMRRVLKSGGTIRLIESLLLRSTMPGFNRFWLVFAVRAARQAGILPEGATNIADLFPDYLAHAQFRSIQRVEREAIYRPGMPEYPLFAADMRLLVRHAEPHIKKWLSVEDYRALAEQINQELDSPRFEQTWTMITTWAIK